MGSKIGSRELLHRVVRLFLVDLAAVDGPGRAAVDSAICHLYLPDLVAGWEIHCIQEVNSSRTRRRGRTSTPPCRSLWIWECSGKDPIFLLFDWDLCLIVEGGGGGEYIQGEVCEGGGWGELRKYMAILGSPEDEYDIVMLQYTEEGLFMVGENRDGRAAAFGDDIAIESLATEFCWEVYV